MATAKKPSVTNDGKIEGQVTNAQQALVDSPIFQLSLGLFKIAAAKQFQTAKAQQEELQKALDAAGSSLSPAPST
ncbi:hypothetical protein [Legionella sp. CNM-4043-24]|uniref:hypothetical protein n=1 Tax=Legionella sp. CNM-4043-24 TaxID=3421646 RepID=UPI00403B211E